MQQSLAFRFLGFLLLLSVIASKVQAQSSSVSMIRSSLDNYSASVLSEKVYVHTDKNIYEPGDTIWYKLYVTDAIDHRPSLYSNLVYLEFINNKDSLLSRQKIYCEKGSAFGQLALPEKIKTGPIRVRVYTNLMRNNSDEFFFNKVLHVWDPILEGSYDSSSSDDKSVLLDEVVKRPVLGIYPESGDLVEGISSKVAIQCRLPDGPSIAVKGRLVNESDELITELKTYETGYGFFEFQPHPAKNYKIFLNWQGVQFSYDLPTVKSSGFVINCNQRNNSIVVKVNGSQSENLDRVRLVGHIRGITFLDEKINFDSDNAFVTIIPTDALQAGVATFTVFGSNGRARAERLVFIDKSIDPLIVNLSDTLIDKRAPIQLSLTHDDSFESKGLDLSLSVYNSSAEVNNLSTYNIRSYLLLASDLRGKIEDIDYYFEIPGDFKRQFLLDLVMMTHGWRRFDWYDIASLPKEYKPEYEAEKGISLQGYTRSFLNKNKGLVSNVILTTMGDTYYEEQKETAENGYFEFGPYIVYDTLKAFLQARKIGKKSKAKLEGRRNIDIQLIEKSYPAIDSYDWSEPGNGESEILVDRSYIEDAREADYKLSSYQDMMEIDLDAFVVTAKKKTRKDSLDEIAKSMSVNYTPSVRVEVDERNYLGIRSVFDMLRNIAGVRIQGNFPNQVARIRGVSSLNASQDPLYLFNGMQVDASYINTINPTEVLFIDVIKDGESAVFGNRGANGVIAVYTGYNDKLNNQKPGIFNFKIKGFNTPKVFYSPDYSRDYFDEMIPDNRSTLYWNPNIRLAPGESFTHNVFSSDRKGRHIVIIEGLSSEGKPVFYEASFVVR